MEDKKRKRTTLILLALLALLLGLLIPFTWRSFKAVKASLMQENSLASATSANDTNAISGSVMHGGWVPSSTPIPLKTSTPTATIPPSPTATPPNSETELPSPTATFPSTATEPLKVTDTIPATVASTLETTKTESPNLTTTPPTTFPFGGTETPGSTETNMPTSTLIVVPPVTPTHTATATATLQPCLPCTATAQVTPATTIVLNDTQVPPTAAPSLPPTVGPGGNPKDYSTAGLIFGLIAIAAFMFYFSEAVISRRKSD